MGRQPVRPIQGKKWSPAEVSEAFIPSGQRYQRQRIEQEERKMTQKERLASENRIEKPLAEAYKNIKNKNEIQSGLKELKSVNKTGKAITGQQMVVLDRLGLKDFFVAGNTMTQIAQKDIERLTLKLAQTLKTGGRMTNFIWQSLGRTLPGLYNTPEGMDAVIDSLMIESKSREAEAKTYAQVVKEYEKRGQKIPLTVQSEVDERNQQLEEYYGKKKLEVVGKALAKTDPRLNPKLHQQGKKARINGSLYRLEGNAWMPLSQEEE